MSRTSNKDHDEDVEVNVPRPGHRLHGARLNAKLELGKAAAQMHLSEETLLAVEADEYGALPSRVFVRGYYRNYARLVGLPEEEILAELDEAWPEEGAPLVIRPVGRHIKPEVRSSHSLVRLFTWLVILGLLSLVVIWWVGYLRPKGEPAPGAAPETAVEHLIAPEGRALPGPEGEQTLALPPVQPEVETPAATGPVAQADAAGQATEVPAETAPVPPQTTQAAAVEPVVVPPPQVPPEAAAQPVPAVVLRFRDDCWVDVRDSTREFRLFGMIKAGSVRRLGGRPPYTVLLGNSKAVEITVDGEAFDQRPYNKGNVARFTLDADRPSSP